MLLGCPMGAMEESHRCCPGVPWVQWQVPTGATGGLPWVLWGDPMGAMGGIAWVLRRGPIDAMGGMSHGC